MVSLSTHKDFRAVQTLPFCYVCGRDFVAGDSKNRDHVPAQKVFHVSHRDPPLWLPTHTNCNTDHRHEDKKVVQLVAVRWGKPTSHRALKLALYPPDVLAVTNVDIRGIVMRWVRGFHAALYGEPLAVGSFKHYVETPFPVAPRTNYRPVIRPISGQHLAYVQTIKEQRALGNLDSIRANKGKLAYECVWAPTDGGEQWLCVFALDLYDWKDLGRTPGQPVRGCAGAYLLPGRPPPMTATRKRGTAITIPNLDQLDPFAP